MFEDLYDSISLMFSRLWPQTDATITRVYIDTSQPGLYRVAYEFTLGEDGPYTGESSTPSWDSTAQIIDVNKTFKIGSPVPVRYKRSNPAVSKIDSSFWDGLDAL